MKVHPAVCLRAVPAIPWKNGGGRTRTLAAEPPNAALGGHAWRVSLAEIDDSGAFSAFAGMDRTILLWRGNGVTLHSPAWPDHSLIRPLEPFPFRGEDDVHCELVNGPAADLNLMVHRDRAEGVVYAGESKLVVPAAGWDDGIVLAAGGAVCVVLPDRSTLTVEAEHMIRVSRADGPLTVVPETTKSRFVCIAVRLQ